MKIERSVLATTGNTPLVDLRRSAPAGLRASVRESRRTESDWQHERPNGAEQTATHPNRSLAIGNRLVQSRPASST
jgi:hypothetical protein